MFASIGRTQPFISFPLSLVNNERDKRENSIKGYLDFYGIKKMLKNAFSLSLSLYGAAENRNTLNGVKSKHSTVAALE